MVVDVQLRWSFHEGHSHTWFLCCSVSDGNNSKVIKRVLVLMDGGSFTTSITTGFWYLVRVYRQESLLLLRKCFERGNRRGTFFGVDRITEYSQSNEDCCDNLKVGSRSYLVATNSSINHPL
jgi:hypothetical protein